MLLQARPPRIVDPLWVQDGGHGVAALPCVSQELEPGVGEQATHAVGHLGAARPARFNAFLAQRVEGSAPAHGEVDGGGPRRLVVVALLERGNHVQVVDGIAVALHADGLGALDKALGDGDGGDAGRAGRALLCTHHHGLCLPRFGMDGQAADRRDAVKDEGHVVAFAHFSEGGRVLGDRGAGFVVADGQALVAAFGEFLLDFVEVEGAAPLVLDVLEGAEAVGHVGDALAELPVGRHQHAVARPEAVRHDHLHRGGARAGHDDDLVAVLTGPRFRASHAFRRAQVERDAQARIQTRHDVTEFRSARRHHGRCHRLKAGLVHANGAGDEEAVAVMRHGFGCRKRFLNTSQRPVHQRSCS